MSGSFDCLATHGVLIIISRISRVVALCKLCKSC
jgi:hypothetical protein